MRAGQSNLSVVIDESVSTAQWERFQAFAAEAGISTTKTLHVCEHHPGMPDGQILRLLLGEMTVLITNEIVAVDFDQLAQRFKAQTS